MQAFILTRSPDEAPAGWACKKVSELADELRDGISIAKGAARVFERLARVP